MPGQGEENHWHARYAARDTHAHDDEGGSRPIRANDLTNMYSAPTTKNSLWLSSNSPSAACKWSSQAFPVMGVVVGPVSLALEVGAETSGSLGIGLSS